MDYRDADKLLKALSDTLFINKFTPDVRERVVKLLNLQDQVTQLDTEVSALINALEDKYNSETTLYISKIENAKEKLARDKQRIAQVYDTQMNVHPMDYYLSEYHKWTAAAQADFDKVKEQCTTVINGYSTTRGYSRDLMEASYRDQYTKLYTEISEIVKGPEGNAGHGVPLFWLTAMKAVKMLAVKISGKDEQALAHLNNVEWCPVEDLEGHKGFKLTFTFDHNDYFSNSVLTKEYYMVDYYNHLLHKAVGTTINWRDGNCLTHETWTKNYARGIKRSKKKELQSFFNFFSTPQLPTTLKPDEVQRCKTKLDYDVGCEIRDKVIPKAVSLFVCGDHDDC